MDEVWVPAFGWEGFYEISSLGRIRSIKRKGRTNFGWRNHGGDIVKPLKARNGYLVVNLTAGSRASHKQELMHRLVLKSFVGAPPAGTEACHNDGDRHNNAIENLRWDTRKNNHADKRQHGTHLFGERLHNHKLDEVSVWAMRSGILHPSEAARNCGVTIETARRAKRGETWGHVSQQETA